MFEKLEVSHSMPNLIPLYVTPNAFFYIPRILRDLNYGSIWGFAMA